MKRLVSYLFISLLFFFLGSVYGFRSGMENYYHLNKLPTALIDSGFYKKIGVGDTETYKAWINDNVDLAFDSYQWYEAHGSRFFSNILLNDYVDSRESYLIRLIDFRKAVPASKNISSMLSEESRVFYLDSVKKRNSFLLSRGVPESQLTKLN